MTWTAMDVSWMFFEKLPVQYCVSVWKSFFAEKLNFLSFPFVSLLQPQTLKSLKTVQSKWKSETRSKENKNSICYAIRKFFYFVTNENSLIKLNKWYKWTPRRGKWKSLFCLRLKTYYDAIIFLIEQVFKKKRKRKT